MSLKNHPKGGFNIERYNFTDSFSSEELLSGDVVQVLNMDGNGNIVEVDGKGDFHYAIYLGEGYFIFKGGAGSDIFITSLEDMKKMYPYEHTFVLQQKRSVTSVLLRYYKSLFNGK